MGRGSREGIDKKYLAITEIIEFSSDFKRKELREMKEINMACSESRILEMTGWAIVVTQNVFFCV